MFAGTTQPLQHASAALKRKGMADLQGCRTLPLHAGHRSCGGGAKPVCRQLLHGCWICCIMPGPSGRIITCTPVPWHSCTAPALCSAAVNQGIRQARGMSLLLFLSSDASPTKNAPRRAGGHLHL